MYDKPRTFLGAGASEETEATRFGGADNCFFLLSIASLCFLPLVCANHAFWLTYKGKNTAMPNYGYIEHIEKLTWILQMRH